MIVQYRSPKCAHTLSAYLILTKKKFIMMLYTLISSDFTGSSETVSDLSRVAYGWMQIHIWCEISTFPKAACGIKLSKQDQISPVPTTTWYALRAFVRLALWALMLDHLLRVDAGSTRNWVVLATAAATFSSNGSGSGLPYHLGKSISTLRKCAFNFRYSSMIPLPL